MLFWGSYWVFDWFRFIFARYDRRIVLQSTLWRALGCNAKVVVPDRRIIRRRFVERCVKIDSCNGGPLPFSCDWKRSRSVQKPAHAVQKVEPSYYPRGTNVSPSKRNDDNSGGKAVKAEKKRLSRSDKFEKIATFGCAKDTPARQCPAKSGIALAFLKSVLMRIWLL